MMIRKRLIQILILLVFGYFLLYLNIPCIFHKITNLYCPGCGITRCIISLLNGNIKEAFNYNRLVFVLLPFLLFSLIYNSYLYIFNKKDKILCRVPRVIYIILLIVTILFGIARNLDIFSYLAPHI